MTPMPTIEPREEPMNQTIRDHVELDSTDVSSATARFFSLAFVCLLFAVPVSQAMVEIARVQKPQALNVFRPFVAGLRNGAAGRWPDLWTAWRDGIKPDALHAYEAAVEQASIFGTFVQPRLQQVLTGVLATGNEHVVLGANGWIFYQPGLEYVVHSSVIDRATLDQATRKMVNAGVDPSLQPDPRPALLQLNRDCRAAGIRLVVVPVPDKAMLQPAQLYHRADASGTLPVGNNVGYARLVEEMRAQGVDWFDQGPQSVRTTDVRFLVQDTHWTPDFMDTVARNLAAHIREAGALTSPRQIPMQIVEEQVSRVGDLVDMLKMTRQQSIFAPQTVRIRKIVDGRSGRFIEPDPTADVLLLGDSFTNVYSRSEMGWGAAAGFGEHLAYHLQRPIDVIAFNGGGALQVRAELARQENAERLGHKSVIVYEFAVRNLLGENWKPIPMVMPRRSATLSTRAEVPGAVVATPIVSTPIRPAKAADTRKPAAEPAAESANAAVKDVPAATAGDLVVVGRIIQTSRVPAPGTAPYKDCLTFIKVRIESVESGSYDGADMIAVLWAMKNDVWLPAASYAVGDRVRMTTIPFSQASADIRGMRRADDTEDYSLRPFYALRDSRE